MSSGIITALALIGFLAVVVWLYFMKSGSDFDEQARQPLDDEIRERRVIENNRNRGESNQ